MPLRYIRSALVVAALCLLAACGSSRSSEDPPIEGTFPPGADPVAILQNYVDGLHAETLISQAATNAVCSRCHSDEGYRAFIGETAGMDSAQLQAALAGLTPPADPSSVQCRTCHVDDFALRAAPTLEEGRVLFSQEFNLCTSCHQVFLNADFDADSGTYSYELNTARAPFHGTANSPGTDTNSRLIWDTHFPSPTDAIVGYNINAAAQNACTQCHDPHGATKFSQLHAPDIAHEWAASGHGDYRGEAFTAGISQAACFKCHSGPQYARFVNGSPLQTGGGAQVVACGACHDLAARNSAGDFDLRAPRSVAAVAFPSGAQVSLGGPSNLCMECHQGRSSTPTVDARIAAGNLDFSNIHYYPAAAVLFGTEVKGGYEYAGRTYRGRNAFTPHALLGAPELTTCAGCHLRGNEADHTFIPDLAVCASCHGGESFETLDGSPLINFGQIAQLKEQLLDLLTASGVVALDGHPYFSNITSAQQLRAAYNWQVADKEPCGYIHNGVYIRQLLFDSIVDMGGTPVVPRP